MDSLIELEIAKRSAPLLRLLQDKGYDILAPRDFASIHALVAQTGRPSQSPMLSLARNDFSQGDAFWLFLMQDGVSVGGCAARYFDLKSESLDAYLRRTSQQQYQCANDPIGRIAAPVGREMGGKMIYMGELQLRDTHRGNFAVVGAFVRLLQAISAIKWPEFDWMYALIPHEHRRIIPHYGYNLQIPQAITWREPVPAGRKNSHILAALKRSHFDHIWSLDEVAD